MSYESRLQKRKDQADMLQGLLDQMNGLDFSALDYNGRTKLMRQINNLENLVNRANRKYTRLLNRRPQPQSTADMSAGNVQPIRVVSQLDTQPIQASIIPVVAATQLQAGQDVQNVRGVQEEQPVQEVQATNTNLASTRRSPIRTRRSAAAQTAPADSASTAQETAGEHRDYTLEDYLETKGNAHVGTQLFYDQAKDRLFQSQKDGETYLVGSAGVDPETGEYLGEDGAVVSTVSNNGAKTGQEAQVQRWQWIYDNILRPEVLFDPKYAKTRENLTDDQWRFMLDHLEDQSKLAKDDPRHTDSWEKYAKHIPDRIQTGRLLGHINRGVNEASQYAIMAIAGAANPMGALASIIGGMATDEIVRNCSKYDSWADLMQDSNVVRALRQSGISDEYKDLLANTLSSFSNPGALIMGTFGATAAPSASTTLLNEGTKSVNGKLTGPQTTTAVQRVAGKVGEKVSQWGNKAKKGFENVIDKARQVNAEEPLVKTEIDLNGKGASAAAEEFAGNKAVAVKNGKLYMEGDQAAASGGPVADNTIIKFRSGEDMGYGVPGEGVGARYTPDGAYVETVDYVPGGQSRIRGHKTQNGNGRGARVILKVPLLEIVREEPIVEETTTPIKSTERIHPYYDYMDLQGEPLRVGGKDSIPYGEREYPLMQEGEEEWYNSDLMSDEDKDWISKHQIPETTQQRLKTTAYKLPDGLIIKDGVEYHIDPQNPDAGYYSVSYSATHPSMALLLVASTEGKNGKAENAVQSLGEYGVVTPGYTIRDSRNLGSGQRYFTEEDFSNKRSNAYVDNFVDLSNATLAKSNSSEDIYYVKDPVTKKRKYYVVTKTGIPRIKEWDPSARSAKQGGKLNYMKFFS